MQFMTVDLFNFLNTEVYFDNGFNISFWKQNVRGHLSFFSTIEEIV